MRIITCASYYGTGSSAITDLVSEFENVYSTGDYEFRFIQDPDGIRDLEYNLVENYNRHNSGHALKKYKRLVDFLSGGKWIKKYENFFHGDFKRLSYKYIDELTDYKFKGYWHEDVRDRGKAFYIRKRLLNKIMQKTWYKIIGADRERGINELPHEITYGSNPGEEKFLTLTRNYTAELLLRLNKENKEILFIDQLFPPTNLKTYVRYVDNIKAVVVERDPRDLFLLERTVWRGTIAPHDVQSFCQWYLATRKHRLNENLNTDFSKLIQFEDLIYKYEETLSELTHFLELDPALHFNKRKFFNPDISIKNTKLYERENKYKDEIKYIERELKDYLYKETL